MRISDWSSDVCSSDLDVGDGHGAEIEIGAVGHAQRSRTVVIVDVATIDAVGSECLLSVHKWLEGGDTRRDDHLRGAAVLAERQIEIVEDGRRDGYPRLPAIRSEEHTSELQSLMRNSYAVFCLKKKTDCTRH